MDGGRVVRTSANSSPSAVVDQRQSFPAWSGIIVVTPKKSCRSFFLQQNHPRRHLGRRRGWFAAPVGLGGSWKTRDGASDKCRRLCFNCGVCSLTLYKCSSFHSTFRISLSLSLFLLLPPSVSLSFSPSVRQRAAPSRKII